MNILVKKLMVRTAGVFMVIVINGCAANFLIKESTLLLLIHLYDSSESAINNQSFLKAEKQACHGMIEGARANDLIARISVNGQQNIFTDPQSFHIREDFQKQCNETPIAQGYGTPVCPAWSASLKLIKRYANYRPVIISQIQTNEGEQFCQAQLKQLLVAISEKKGKLLILNSTNEGNSQFNQELAETLNNLPNNQFCADNERACVTTTVQAVRNH